MWIEHLSDDGNTEYSKVVDSRSENLPLSGYLELVVNSPDRRTVSSIGCRVVSSADTHQETFYFKKGKFGTIPERAGYSGPLGDKDEWPGDIRMDLKDELHRQFHFMELQMQVPSLVLLSGGCHGAADLLRNQYGYGY